MVAVSHVHWTATMVEIYHHGCLQWSYPSEASTDGPQPRQAPANKPRQHERVPMSQKKDTPKRTRRTTPTNKSPNVLTADERAAMKELVQERRAQARGQDEESAVLGKIAEMPEPDRAMAERLHVIIKASAPSLSPKTWYGMPAYAKDGKVVCFFQSAAKFKARYATFGFSDKANLDDGNMWPTYFALKELTSAEEKKIARLVKEAAS
jgi:uncharacterized protein YdhG (YjbR/CyaY superfamily)